MDFGDIIYVILAIVFSAAGALGKRKKKPSTQKKSSPVRDIFEELFEAKEDDPVQQFEPQYEPEDYVAEDIVPEYALEEEPVESYRSFQDEVKYKKEENNSVFSTEHQTGIHIHDETKSRKRHSILVDLHQRNEVQKAVIYSEILKPKF